MTAVFCPNCLSPVLHHPENSCVLAALIDVIRNRGELPEEQVLLLHERAAVDRLWNDLGPVIDRLAEGLYTEQP